MQSGWEEKQVAAVSVVRMGLGRVPVSELGWLDAIPSISSREPSAALSLVEPYEFGHRFSAFKYCTYVVVMQFRCVRAAQI